MTTFLSFATGLPGSISFGPQDDENGESEEHGGVPLPPPPPYEQPSNGMQCVDDLVCGTGLAGHLLDASIIFIANTNKINVGAYILKMFL